MVVIRAEEAPPRLLNSEHRVLEPAGPEPWQIIDINIFVEEKPDIFQPVFNGDLTEAMIGLGGAEGGLESLQIGTGNPPRHWGCQE